MDKSELKFPAWPSKLLIGIPDGARRLEFSNMEDLEKEVAAQGSSCFEDPNANVFLVVLNIPYDINQQLDNSTELEKKHIALDLAARILVIETMASGPHEHLVRQFDFCMAKKLEQMGVTLVPTGSVKVEHGRYRKDPDCSWQPMPKAGTPCRIWPTLVVEVGWSESMAKLAVDAQGWLEAQGSGVEIAITVKIDRTAPKMTFQKWERREPRRITRHTHVEAAMTQEARVAHEYGKTTVSGSIDIQFEKLCDRPPDANNPQERDITISQMDISNIAEYIWRAQGIAIT